MIKIYFKSVDWYHCDIYRRRLWFFDKLIGQMKQNLKGEFHMYIYDKSGIMHLIPALGQQARQFMLEQREG